jgi:tetratricopeptide (TPR) repeat protein
VRRPLVFALLLAFGFVLYANAIGNEFVFDDLVTFAKKDLSSFHGLLDEYRPARYASFVLDHAISGKNPWGYHVLNIVYHAVAGLLVFVVLRRLLPAGPAEPPTSGTLGLLRSAGPALPAALLFVAHPVHTESVAYVSGRRDLLSTILFLLGFLAWLEYGKTSRARWLLWFGAAYGTALLVKEMAVTLPAVCLLHDLLLDRGGLRRRIPVYAGGALAAAAAAVLIARSGATTMHEWHGGSATANFATSARLVLHYARLFVFPATLLADYSAHAFPLSRSFLEPRVLVALGALLVVLAAAFLCRRRAPLVSFGIGWILLTLTPVLHIIPFHELAADHYAYLPSVGFCLLLGLAFDRLARYAGPRAAWAGLALVLVAFSARTIVRNRDWKDSETLWLSVIETAPECARGHYNLGIVYAQRAAREDPGGAGQLWTHAAACMKQALKLVPDYLQAHIQLARIQMEHLGQQEEALSHFEEALRIVREAKSRPISAGEIYFHMHRWEDAVPILEEDLRKGYREKGALWNLVFCYQKTNQPEKALAACEQLLHRVGDQPILLQQTIVLADYLGDKRRAATYRARLARLKPRR